MCEWTANNTKSGPFLSIVPAAQAGGPLFDGRLMASSSPSDGGCMWLFAEDSANVSTLFKSAKFIY